MKKLIILLLMFATISAYSQAVQPLPTTISFNTLSKPEARFLIRSMNSFMQEEPDSVDMACYNHLVDLKKFTNSGVATQNFANIPQPFARYLVRRNFSGNVLTHRTNTGLNSQMYQSQIDRAIADRDRAVLMEKNQQSIQCRILLLMNKPCPY